MNTQNTEITGYHNHLRSVFTSEGAGSQVKCSLKHFFILLIRGCSFLPPSLLMSWCLLAGVIALFPSAWPWAVPDSLLRKINHLLLGCQTAKEDHKKSVSPPTTGQITANIYRETWPHINLISSKKHLYWQVSSESKLLLQSHRNSKARKLSKPFLFLPWLIIRQWGEEAKLG